MIKMNLTIMMIKVKIAQTIIIKNKIYVINLLDHKLIKNLVHIILRNNNKEILILININLYKKVMIQFKEFVKKEICKKLL